jgi:ATP dependent DNA ligase C terminal region
VRSSRGYLGLLLGIGVGRELRYVGTVEWGVGRHVVEAVMHRAPVTSGSPFTDLRRNRDVTWVQPRVRVAVTFSEIVGGRLRDPVLRSIN